MRNIKSLQHLKKSSFSPMLKHHTQRLVAGKQPPRSGRPVSLTYYEGVLIIIIIIIMMRHHITSHHITRRKRQVSTYICAVSELATNTAVLRRNQAPDRCQSSHESSRQPHRSLFLLLSLTLKVTSTNQPFLLLLLYYLFLPLLPICYW